eukprot:jgi/Chlat1/5018/Chrsp32S08951
MAMASPAAALQLAVWSHATSARRELRGQADKHKRAASRATALTACRAEASQCCEDSPTSPPPADAMSVSKKLAGRAATLLATAVMLAETCLGSPLPAAAVLSSPKAEIPRSVEAALRRAIPAVNRPMKKIQDNAESDMYLLRIPNRKPYGTMARDTAESLKLAKESRDEILGGVPAEKQQQAAAYLDELVGGKNGLEAMAAAISAQNADLVAVRLNSVLDLVADIQLLQAPGLSFLLPKEYASLPRLAKCDVFASVSVVCNTELNAKGLSCNRLAGRATVDVKVKHKDGENFVPKSGTAQEDEPTKVATLEIALDGYSAPLTAGHFVLQVLDGYYNGVDLALVGSALLAGPNRNVPKGANALDDNPIPLEVLQAGEFEPHYRSPLNIQEGEFPVLPLSIYGAVAMAHAPDGDISYSDPDQWFFYLYDRRQSGLGGLSFDEGQFSVFGYVTKGKEFLSQLKSGDVVESVTLTSGKNRLVQ